MREDHNSNYGIGIVLIGIGVLWALKSLGIWNRSFFFTGWWAFIIILASAYFLTKKRTRVSGIGGIIIGFELLLWARGYLSPGTIRPLVGASMFVTIGLHIMFDHERNTRQFGDETKQTESYSYEADSEQSTETFEEYHTDFSTGEGQQSQSQSTFDGFGESTAYSETVRPGNMISAILVGKAFSYQEPMAPLTRIQAIVGNLQLDLRNVPMEEDITLDLMLVLGGVDIYLPPNVRVVQETQNILGEVRDLRGYWEQKEEYIPTIHLRGTCILGGLELK